MSEPIQASWKPSEGNRAGRQLAQGRLVATVKSLVTGEHITVGFACKLKLDPPADDGSRWKSVPFDEASHVFVNAGRRDRVGTLYPRSGKFYPSDLADRSRLWAAFQVMIWAAGMETSPSAELMSADLCGRCGRQLTDPVSLDRGIGPECYGKITGSQHQQKELEFEPDYDLARDRARGK